MSCFKEKHSFENRKNESSRIRSKYPERIPIIVEKKKGSDIPEIDKIKYLVPFDLTIGQFIYVVRKRLKLPPEKAIFIFINNTIPASSMLMSEIYKNFRDEDGYLYCMYTSENVFG